MTDPSTPETPDTPDTPETPDAAATPGPGPDTAHGDAFLDQSGSRHGLPPEEDDDASGDEPAA